MRTPRSSAGFSLVEAMIATVLLSMLALALTDTLTAALRARARSQRWMQAIELASEGLEQLRAGHTLRPLPGDAGFERAGTTSAWSGHSGVERLDVVVSWQDDAPQRFQLTTLVRR